VYAGRVGTGYSHAMAKELWGRLHPLETATPPFDVIPPEERRRRDVRWVKPQIVIESHFRGWTADHVLRQAAFNAVRGDKPAKEVVLEMPTASNEQAPRSPRNASKIAAENNRGTAKTSKV